MNHNATREEIEECCRQLDAINFYDTPFEDLVQVLIKAERMLIATRSEIREEGDSDNDALCLEEILEREKAERVRASYDLLEPDTP
jgi:hypothetical protein